MSYTFSPSFSFYSNISSNSGTLPNPPRNMKSLDDLYKITNHIDDDLTLYWHFGTCDPIVFEETIKDKNK